MLVSKLLQFCVCLLSFIFIMSNADDKGREYHKSYNNLIILLDNGAESIENNNYCLTAKLLAAIQKPSANILVSSSILRYIAEMRQSFALKSEVPGSPENIIITHYKKINRAINYWFEYFKDQDEVHQKELVVDQINEKFCTPKAIKRLSKKNKLVDKKKINDLMYRFIFYYWNLDLSKWKIYKVNNDFYLFIPKFFIKSMKKESHDKKIKSAALLRNNLGFKIESFTKIKDPFEIVQFQFGSLRKKGMFKHTLEEIFEFDEKEVSDQIGWKIYLAGHGQNYVINGKSYFREIANLTVEEFKSFLHFLNNKIKTSVLIYSSCFAGGNQLQSIYKKQETFNYNIIIGCLTDTLCYGYVIHLKKISYGDDLSIDDLKQDNQGNWSVKAISKTNFKKFFTWSFSNKSELIRKANFEIFPDCIANIPLIRKANNDAFFPLYSKYAIKISKILLMLKRLKKQNIVIKDKYILFFDILYVSEPVIIKKRFPKVISLCESEIYFLKQLEAKECKYNDVISGFFPLKTQRFKKTFLIKKLTIANDPESSEAQILKATKSTLTLKNLIIQQHKNALRIYFETDTNRLFYIYATKNGDSLDVSGLFEIPDSAQQKYIEYFKSLKNQIKTHKISMQDLQQFAEKLKNFFGKKGPKE